MANTNAETASPKRAPGAGDKRLVLVVNNEERVRVLKLRGKIGQGSNTLVPGPQIDLIPGLNVVEATLWDRWKRENEDRQTEDGEERGVSTILLRDRIPRERHSHRRREREGQPFLVEGPRINSRTTPLADLDEQAAIGLVPEVLDRIACARFLKAERRAAVAEALRSQLEVLETPAAADVG